MRFFYLDFSRSSLFFLGVVLHAAYLCVEGHHSFQSVHDVIHSFRMEAFYLIAGFFTAVSLERSTAASYLRKRILRLGLPFVFGALVVDTLSNCANHWDWSDFGAEFSASYWTRGDWLEHLWFLPTLLAYTGALVLVRSVWHKLPAALRERRFSPGFVLAIVCVAYFGAIHVENVIPWQMRLDTFLSTYKTEKYAAFFALGYILFYRRDILEAIVSHPWFNLGNVLAYLAMNLTVANAGYGAYFIRLWHPLFCVSICGLLFFGARRFFDKPNPIVRSLSDASYTVYLVHWPFMIIINRLLMHSGLGALPTLLSLIVLTSVFSFLFHVHVVKRLPLFAFLLNGQLPDTRVRHATALSRAGA